MELCVGDRELCVGDREVCVGYVGDRELCVGDRKLCVGDRELCVGDRIVCRMCRGRNYNTEMSRYNYRCVQVSFCYHLASVVHPMSPLQNCILPLIDCHLDFKQQNHSAKRNQTWEG